MLSGKDIYIDKEGNIHLNGDVYKLASQTEIDAVKEDIDDLGDTIGDITQTGVTGASVAAQLEELGDQITDFAVKTWTPKIYDLNTFKRDAPAQKYIKIGALYVMFMEGTFDFSDITTMLNIKNLPCNYCVGGTLYFGSLLDAAKGLRVQGLNNEALPRPNIISTDLGSPSASTNNCFIFFGYDII